jgi:hypothetical protein
MSAVIDAENISKRLFLGERNQKAFFEESPRRACEDFIVWSDLERVKARRPPSGISGLSGTFPSASSGSNFGHHRRKRGRQIHSSQDSVENHAVNHRNGSKFMVAWPAFSKLGPGSIPNFPSDRHKYMVPPDCGVGQQLSDKLKAPWRFDDIRMFACNKQGYGF